MLRSLNFLYFFSAWLFFVNSKLHQYFCIWNKRKFQTFQIKISDHSRTPEYVNVYASAYFWFMSWIRYQFYRMKWGIIPSIEQGSRRLSKGSALYLPVKAVLQRFAYRVQETSQELCTSASRVPASSARIHFIKSGVPIRRINKAIPLTVQSSHENEGGTAAMELSEFHAFKKSHWCWILIMHIEGW